MEMGVRWLASSQFCTPTTILGAREHGRFGVSLIGEILALFISPSHQSQKLESAYRDSSKVDSAAVRMTQTLS
ncbi:hypothetical protein VTK56DRAFT_6513 [Thermocarpiscus australiensis]